MNILPTKWKVYFRLWFIHWVKLGEALIGIASFGFLCPTWFIKSSGKVIKKYKDAIIEKVGFFKRIGRFVTTFFKILDKDIL